MSRPGRWNFPESIYIDAMAKAMKTKVYAFQFSIFTYNDYHRPTFYKKKETSNIEHQNQQSWHRGHNIYLSHLSAVP